MELDPATGLARVIHDNTNTGGALSRSKNGALFLASRGVGAGILQLEPQRKVLANTVGGEPLDCVGGVAERPDGRRPRRRVLGRVERRVVLRRRRKAS